MPFGLTNAVPAFQRIIDSIIRKANLSKTYAYLDDVIICGITKEEHDLNLNSFMSAIKESNMTLNMDKSQFCLKSMPLLSYIIENKTKRPNPERTQALKDIPVPTDSAQLQRTLGLFAYNAKWVPNYSNKIQPLLDSLKQHAFPLDDSALNSLSTIKMILQMRVWSFLTKQTDQFSLKLMRQVTL